ncbi:MAG: flagellar FlaF family protein [Kordiimonas sp.]|nr:flagellar FlaF family protein [Kordiimonas sp.]
MSLKAYQQTQKASETPSQTEYRLFADVTRALMASKDCDKTDPALHDALGWNRRLWSTLASDCGLEGNQLPQGLRASIISLSIWVSKYSSQVARGEEDINALIDINKTIMEGLAMQSELQQAQSTQETIQTEGVTTQA